MVLGLWFESARAMFFLFILLNALPVPMLRQVYFQWFFRCSFFRLFLEGFFSSFFEVLGGFEGPKGGHFWHIS